MTKYFLVFLILFLDQVKATSFKSAIEKIRDHEALLQLKSKADALIEEGNMKGSWGDPKLKISIKNLPVRSLKANESPMSGIEFGLSQKIPITTKYNNIKRSIYSLSNAQKFERKNKEESLKKDLWSIVIVKRSLKQELKILKESFIWINNIIKVSKKLYSTGKISQQALLEIEIRRTEIERGISNNKFETLKTADQLKYLISKNEIDMNSIPWKILNEKENKNKDYKELFFKEMIKAKELSVFSSYLDLIPDLVLSTGFTKRSNLDGKGDFVSASVSFTLPFSTKKYSKKNKEAKAQEVVLNAYKNYKKLKRTKLLSIEKETKKLKEELKILNNKTIYFAKSMRSITSKSYGIGNSSYSELLNSELKLQKILMHKVMLEARVAKNQVKLKYIKGEDLNE